MKHAVYTGTREIYADMVPAVKSLLRNSDVDAIHLLVEDDEFPEFMPECVEILNVRDQGYFHKGGPNMKSPYSYMALMRAAVCKVFPDMERALVLDVDTIAVRDVSEIWGLDLENSYIAATPEWHRTRWHGLMYCNCGVVLQNLEKLRDWKADEVIDTLNRRYYRWVDQDVYNYTCQGHITEMPAEYNANHWTVKGFFDLPEAARKKNARIVHYAGIKDYRCYPEYVKYRDMPWDDVMEGR